jgi:hypothetical protein
MNKGTRGLSLLAVAGLILAAGAGRAHAQAYFTGKVSNDIVKPTQAVYDVKCATKAPVCANVWDMSPDFSFLDNFHVSSVCISPLAAKGKGQLQNYLGWLDENSTSPDACTPSCSEAIVTVQCDSDPAACSDAFMLTVACNGSKFATGFPKVVK